MWRDIKLAAAIIGSLIIIVVATPILWALGRDRRERMASDLYPYDDDDPGDDVDVADEMCTACGETLGYYGCDVCDDLTDIGGECGEA